MVLINIQLINVATKGVPMVSVWLQTTELHHKSHRTPGMLVRTLGLVFLVWLYQQGFKSNQLKAMFLQPPFRSHREARRLIGSGEIKPYVVDHLWLEKMKEDYLFGVQPAEIENVQGNFTLLKRHLCSDPRNVFFGETTALSRLWQIRKGCIIERSGTCHAGSSIPIA